MGGINLSVCLSDSTLSHSRSDLVIKMYAKIPIASPINTADIITATIRMTDVYASNPNKLNSDNLR